MASVRRWYVYLVCFVSLQAVTWAVIDLLRSLLIAGQAAPLLGLAFQMAVIIIGLPVFLVHWLLAQRAAREVDERASGIRRFYLYVTLAACLAPALAEAYGLLAGVGRRLLGLPVAVATALGPNSLPELFVRVFVALIVLGALWVYHWRVLAHDLASTETTDGLALLRRLYVLGFSAAGVSLAIGGLIGLLRWMLAQLGPDSLALADDTVFANSIAALLVGLPLWLLFWRQAQRLFAGGADYERDSALRKFYLYALVGVAVITGVTNLTFILAGLFRRLLGLAPQGRLGDSLPIVLGMALVWAYHAAVLRDDAARAATAPRQAGVRRLYEYLVAAIGLAAFLIGLGGVISVLIQSGAGRLLGDGLREQLAWSTAALLAGLPVWLLPWRRAQLAAAAPGPAGVDERRSALRRLYLYLFIFAATMTVLSSAVYVVYRLLSLLFGARFGSLFVDLGQALAFILIGVAVWVYHGLTIRADNQRNRQARASKLAGQSVVVVSGNGDSFGPALVEALRRELPELAPGLIDAAAPVDESARTALDERLAAAGLIVGDWQALGGAALGGLRPAIEASPACKLLVPARHAGWDWAGVDRWTPPALVAQTVYAVSQWAEGEEIRPSRPQSAASLVLIIAGVLVAVFVVAPLLIGLVFLIGNRGF